MSENINISSVSKVLGSVVIGTFFWEHFGRVQNVNFRPSVGMTYAGEKAVEAFTSLGALFAKLSSYLHWIKFDEFFITVKDLLTSGFKLITSPVHLFHGYVKTALSYVKGPVMIYGGSFLLCGTFAYLIYRYHKSIPVVNRICSGINFQVENLAVFCGKKKETIIPGLALYPIGLVFLIVYVLHRKYNTGVEAEK
jgi:hypothetical protein